jgi:hypothetical protein
MFVIFDHVFWFHCFDKVILIVQVNHNQNHGKTRSHSDPICSLKNHVYCPNPDNTDRLKEASVSEKMLYHGKELKIMSYKDIESKLEAMENYLDGFYTKAKSDVRSIKKLIQDEKMGT